MRSPYISRFSTTSFVDMLLRVWFADEGDAKVDGESADAVRESHSPPERRGSSTASSGGEIDEMSPNRSNGEQVIIKLKKYRLTRICRAYLDILTL